MIQCCLAPCSQFSWFSYPTIAWTFLALMAPHLGSIKFRPSAQHSRSTRTSPQPTFPESSLPSHPCCPSQVCWAKRDSGVGTSDHVFLPTFCHFFSLITLTSPLKAPFCGPIICKAFSHLPQQNEALSHLWPPGKLCLMFCNRFHCSTLNPLKTNPGIYPTFYPMSLASCLAQNRC